MKKSTTRHILTLAWEYPPKVVGGLARHAGFLSRALVREGHRVTVLTQGDPALPPEEDDAGVRVVRLPVHEPRPRDFTGWVKRLNFEMVQRGVRDFARGERFDVIHAHDWLAAYAGKTLKHGLAVPLIATVHATEYGRNNGLHNDLQRYISNVEWSLTYEAWRVICCSRFMEREIHRVFQTPLDKIRVVANGVPLPDGEASAADAAEDKAFRRRFAAPGEPLVFFMGRLVYEKGVHVLLDAMAKLRRHRSDVRLVVAGDGPLRGPLADKAAAAGLDDAVTFFGFADDGERDRFLRIAQAAVFPSLYEPFGIVALEAMAAGVPVVAGDVGGFAEIVRAGRTGLLAPPGDGAALADELERLLSDEALARRLGAAGRREVEERYGWDRIARVTADVYEEVLAEYRRSRWAREARPAGRETAAGRWTATVRGGEGAAGAGGLVAAPVGRYTGTGDGAAELPIRTEAAAGDGSRSTV